MDKVELDLNDLEVDSFKAKPSFDEEGDGTVNANALSSGPSADRTDCEACGGTDDTDCDCCDMYRMNK